MNQNERQPVEFITYNTRNMHSGIHVIIYDSDCYFCEQVKIVINLRGSHMANDVAIQSCFDCINYCFDNKCDRQIARNEQVQTINYDDAMVCSQCNKYVQVVYFTPPNDPVYISIALCTGCVYKAFARSDNFMDEYDVPTKGVNIG